MLGRSESSSADPGIHLKNVPDESPGLVALARGRWATTILNEASLSEICGRFLRKVLKAFGDVMKREKARAEVYLPENDWSENLFVIRLLKENEARMKNYLWLLLALLLPSEAASAIGEQYGRITGVVYNPEGAEQAGVSLTLTSPVLIGGPKTIFSSEDGSFTFNNLPPGKYDLTAENQGLRTFIKTGISVSVGKTASVYLAMEFATDENGIPLEPYIQTPRSIDTMIPTEIIEDVPMGRSYQDVAIFLPGVVDVNGEIYGNGGTYKTYGCCFGNCIGSVEEPLMIWPTTASPFLDSAPKLPKEGQSLESFVLELPRTEVKGSILRMNGQATSFVIDGQLLPPQMTKQQRH
jgi:hypothetical protein